LRRRFCPWRLIWSVSSAGSCHAAWRRLRVTSALGLGARPARSSSSESEPPAADEPEPEGSRAGSREAEVLAVGGTSTKKSCAQRESESQRMGRRADGETRGWKRTHAVVPHALEPGLLVIVLVVVVDLVEEVAAGPRALVAAADEVLEREVVHGRVAVAGPAAKDGLLEVALVVVAVLWAGGALAEVVAEGGLGLEVGGGGGDRGLGRGAGLFRGAVLGRVGCRWALGGWHGCSAQEGAGRVEGARRADELELVD